MDAHGQFYRSQKEGNRLGAGLVDRIVRMGHRLDCDENNWTAPYEWKSIMQLYPQKVGNKCKTKLAHTFPENQFHLSRHIKGGHH